MSSDDQYFLDLLSSVPNDVKRYSHDIAEAIDRHVDFVASQIRDSLSSSPWIPDAAARPFRRPAPPPPPAIHRGALGAIQRIECWVSAHRKLVAFAVVTTGLAGYVLYQRRRSQTKKRRARRAENGARVDVVVISGSLDEPATRTIALELERKGFIVYIIARTAEEEQRVEWEGRADIKSLRLDLPDELTTQNTVSTFLSSLRTPRQAFPSALPHRLRLRGLILIPSTLYAVGPTSSVPLDAWSDALNTRILSSVALVQAFHDAITSYKARVLVLTPSIVPVLRLPTHGIESAAGAALGAWADTLRKELKPEGVEVCQLRMGGFDFSERMGRRETARRREGWLKAIGGSDSEGEGERAEDGEGEGQVGSLRRGGGNVKELNDAVFDALTVKRPRRVWRVGAGSLVYDIVGAWVPSGAVGYMLGLRTGRRD